MAQLKDTSVAGNLSVTGHVTNNTTPTADGHLVNKAYADTIASVQSHIYGIVGNNVTGENRWNRFTSDNFDITLQPGVYMVNYSCTASAAGSGVLTARLINNESELVSMSYQNRVSTACNSTMLSTLNCSFVVRVDEETDFSIWPQIYGSATWTGRGAAVNIIKLGSGTTPD